MLYLCAHNLSTLVSFSNWFKVKTRSLSCLPSEAISFDLVWNDEELVSQLVSGIFLMTFILVGVNHLEGGGTCGPHCDGSQELDVVLRVVQRYEGSLSLVLAEHRVDVFPASYSNLTHCGPGR